MRKTGVLAVAIIAALMMVIPAVSVPVVSVSSDAVDPWDNNSSAYSIDGKDVSSGLYSLLTNGNEKHVGLYVLDKTGYNFLANEGKDGLGVISTVANSHISDGVVKKIENDYETIVEKYNVVRADISVVVTIGLDVTELGSLINKLYTTEDRGFSELRTYLGTTDVNQFTSGDTYSLDCHIESYLMETTTTYFKETTLGDYYVSQTVVETKEILHVTGATLKYTPSSSKQTISVPCSIDVNGSTRVITSNDFGSTKPVSGTAGKANVYTSSVNDGKANYTFSDSTHTAVMTDPESTKSDDITCDAYKYSDITGYIAKTDATDLYPDTDKPSTYIDSISGVVIHYSVSDVNNDITNLQREFGIIKDVKDNSYLKTILYIVVAALVLVGLIFIYFKVIRNRR